VGFPPSFRGRGSSASVLGKGSIIRDAYSPESEPDASSLLVPCRADPGLFCHTSGHQPVDGVSPLPPKMTGGHSGELGHLGQGHAEHPRRVEDGGIGDCQAVADRIDDGSGQELLTGATDRCREGVQLTGGAALA